MSSSLAIPTKQMALFEWSVLRWSPFGTEKKTQQDKNPVVLCSASDVQVSRHLIYFCLNMLLRSPNNGKYSIKEEEKEEDIHWQRTAGKILLNQTICAHAGGGLKMQVTLHWCRSPKERWAMWEAAINHAVMDTHTHARTHTYTHGP